MNNNNTYTSFDKFVLVRFPSYMKKVISYTKPISYTKLTIVYEVLHSYTNMNIRILKFI